MTRLKLNREYASRHAGVALVMLALAGWFGWDGFVRYPATPAAELYFSIEGREAPPATDLEAFKVQKTAAQRGLMIAALAAALVIGGRLLAAARFRFEFDDDGFACGGRRFSYADVKNVDRSRWKKKGIVVVNGIKLDAWHHLGVGEFEKKLKT